MDEIVHSIDLNCDMGEGCPNDAELMDYVSSVNIACGFHSGDEMTMRRTVETAIAKGVAIGAHPSYPDRENFGRTPMTFPPDEIRAMITEQILSLSMICHASSTKLHHVKPHGAMYNQAARDAELAAAIASAVRDIDPGLVLFGLSGSVSIAEAEKIGLRTASEVFADRTYTRNGDLTPRREPSALITDPDTAAEQALSMVTAGRVVASDGTPVRVKADTICIHGDGEHALEFARAIRSLLLNNNITIHSVNG